ncbi:divergent polysaccharide deacetylase family protein [Paraglaciecola aquimarina]|uniref:Divergent polysaccharide deacetylase family protein n=1 Tax=Paraglaciecola algarum TaxID=3050085 RepID=A0ABS9D5A6_9ALTE|nr:divergent polysaccharide deacetylase family protein [Paraglaciecola sp. G1-23]MCF2948095.1 divergent polysaccharide deacetylase family protein [Paraglaciecola sp. G1-23]
MRLFIFTILLLFTAFSNAAQISLIIDDMGNNKKEEAAFLLPAEVTFAILPNKNLSQIFSNRAAKQEREVILHMPMESLARVNQEEGVLLSSMQPNEIVETLKAALKTVPHAVGVNNHMGSRLTQLTMPMSVTMEYLSKRGLFFVDSRTTRYSKAEQIANKSGVLNTKRNVFLDHNLQPKKIEQEFHRLIMLAKKYGHAVGIAHPHAQTLNYLQKHLPSIEKHGVSLVKLSDLVSQSSQLVKIADSESATPIL